jgi:hypothetical protein
MAPKKRKTDEVKGGEGGGSSVVEEENKPEKSNEPKVGRVPMRSIKANDLLSKIEYLKVVSVDYPNNKMRVQVLRADKKDDFWDITTPDDFLACSTEYVQRTEKVSKTELANRLIQCKDNVFKLVYRPVLDAERLAQRMQELETEIAEAKNDSARKKVAKKLLEVPEKTIKGRLINANNCLGHSLVDDLDQTDTQKVAFRTVAHGNILALTVAGTQFLLK